ncbi:phage terminase large subunit family protein [Halorhodospira sp. 9622]|uniref:phage terminase large subunit family protein n=1 Tax=Halorhodospira sp. 9622 TaxID=2899136 RepID=UPI001EE7D38D|nr:terminase gpA endonuclease subunit [Halorhodospira sp. 9622]MCG5538955.1 phage terminase large subunit family protein [Halorhodospira sp. 9622]
MTKTASATALLAEVAEIARPPQRLSVPDAAERHVMLDIPGGYQGPWSNDLPWYMVEPARCLTDRRYEAVIFVGPAQSAKTAALIENWVAHSVVCDPGDMMIVQTAQETARDYSRRRIDRMIDASPDLRARLRVGQGDNTHDKTFSSGMILSLGWPTKNQLAGKAIGRMALTDYDRMPPDVGGEGSPFDLARKRTTTFLSRGMTVAESSPSRPVRDPKWRPQSPHEAPPTDGILGLYNTGDRRRLYGRCPECGEYFMPAAGIEAVTVPEEGSVDHRAENAALICTANGCLIHQDAERRFKRDGLWLREGQEVLSDGRVVGDPVRSRRASFWMPGWFAAFQPWRSIVSNYLMAYQTLENTGDEEPLKSSVNTDMAAPYIYQAQLQDTRDGSYLLARAESWSRFHVPEGVRVLLAAVDVQNNRFEVGVWGYGVGGEKWIVDRYAIPDVQPASRIEDWELVTEKVAQATYRLGDGRELQVHRVAVDHGGEAGASQRAYEWWRQIRHLGLGRRVRLVKGQRLGRDHFRETYPDSRGRKDRKTGGRGDVPLLQLNSDVLKDIVYSDLQRESPGPGYVHVPDWLAERYADELTAEIRTEKGWDPIPGRRNETFDLAYYVHGLWLFIRGGQIRWDNPPPWAQEMETNTNVMDASERRAMKAPAPRRRGRVSRSSLI